MKELNKKEAIKELIKATKELKDATTLDISYYIKLIREKNEKIEDFINKIFTNDKERVKKLKSKIGEFEAFICNTDDVDLDTRCLYIKNEDVNIIFECSMDEEYGDTYDWGNTNWEDAYIGYKKNIKTVEYVPI